MLLLVLWAYMPTCDSLICLESEMTDRLAYRDVSLNASLVVVVVAQVDLLVVGVGEAPHESLTRVFLRRRVPSLLIRRQLLLVLLV